MVLLLAWSIPSTVCGGDWPQILGPHRNGVAEGEQLADAWPKDGPRLVWERQVGRGYAGAAIRGGVAILFHRVGQNETTEALDLRNGNRIWKSEAPSSYESGISPDDGPRAVPIIHDDLVITFGAQGRLTCYRLKDGGKVWSRATHEDFRAPEGYFGAGSSPIVEAGKVIVNVGGDKSLAAVVAFSLKDGATVWKTGRDQASYSSPVVATIGGTRSLFIETRLTTYALDPESGKARWEIPFGMRGPTVNGANPTVIGDTLYLTASYGIGMLSAKVGADSAQVAWTSDDLISSQYTTCIEDRGLLYGIHGRDDQGTALLRCVDPKRKAVLWEQEFGYATLLKADGKLIALKTDGRLVLLRVDGSAYHELAAADVLQPKTFALPALSEGRLLLRNEKQLKCLDLSRPKS